MRIGIDTEGFDPWITSWHISLFHDDHCGENTVVRRRPPKNYQPGVQWLLGGMRLLIEENDCSI